jgi:LysR family transcriptional activator of nhaA
MTTQPESSLSRLNYHHLGYFWAVGRAGSIGDAARRLHISQATVSGQIKVLERTLGQKLYQRRGNRLELTATGKVVFRYASEIFGTGSDLLDFLDGSPSRRAVPFNVGLADVVPKLIAVRLLAPVLGLATPVHLVCHEDKSERLLSGLLSHDLDLVLTDHQMPPGGGVRAYHHLLGECGVTWCASPAMAARHRRRFPRCLHGAPVLLPIEGTALRRSLEQWFHQQRIAPQVVCELADSALLKSFGSQGHGMFPVPSAVEDEVLSQYRCVVIGRTDQVRERYYAISVERRLSHPAMVAIAANARGNPLV